MDPIGGLIPVGLGRRLPLRIGGGLPYGLGKPGGIGPPDWVGRRGLRGGGDPVGGMLKAGEGLPENGWGWSSLTALSSFWAEPATVKKSKAKMNVVLFNSVLVKSGIQ